MFKYVTNYKLNISKLLISLDKNKIFSISKYDFSDDIYDKKDKEFLSIKNNPSSNFSLPKIMSSQPSSISSKKQPSDGYKGSLERRNEELKRNRDESELILSNSALNSTFYMKNRIFSKYMNYIKKYHSDSFKSIFNLNTIELIIKQVANMEKELNVMKEQNIRGGDNKTQNLFFETEKKKSSNLGNQDTSFDNIFCSSTIKEIENKIAQLPLLTVNDINFKYKLLSFYSERNIDKAFEYFYDNLKLEDVEDDIIQKELKKFISRLIELDKLTYLNVIYDFIEKNKIILSSIYSIQEFSRLFDNFFHFHMLENFNYDNSILGMKYLLNYLVTLNRYQSGSSAKQKFSFSINFSDVFDNLCNHKFNSRKVKASDDEMLNLIHLYSQIKSESLIKETNINVNFKDESIAKIFTIFFDNTIVVKNETNVIDLIFSISKKHLNFIENLNYNVIAYYQFFGFPPKILSGNNLKQAYLNFREKIVGQTSLKSSILRENELEFFVTLFGYNNMPEYITDVIDNWSKLSRDNVFKSNRFSCVSADFILNSTLIKGNYYHKQIENLFKLKISNNFDHLVYITLAYLKDGNIKFAVENFFKNLETGIKSAKDNDKALLDLYHKSFSHLLTPPKNSKFSTTSSQEKEFQFTLQKIDLLENIKFNISNMYRYLKLNEDNNEISIQSKVESIFKNINKNLNNSYLNNLKLSIVEDLNKLKNLNINDIIVNVKTQKEKLEQDSNKLEDLFNQIKVCLYLNGSLFNLISDIIEKDIISVNDLSNLEFDSARKQIILKSIIDFNKNRNLKADDKKFLKLVYEYIKLKEVSYNKIESLSEETIRNITDGDLLLNYSKFSKYIKETKKYFEFADQKYKSNKGINTKNLEFLNEIGVNIHKAVIEKNTIEEKIEFFEKILSNYKQLLTNLYKQKAFFSRTNYKGFLPYTGKIFDNEMKNLILSKSVTPDFSILLINKIGLKLSNLSNRKLYHNLITLNKINNHRSKNIIKAIKNYKEKLVKKNTIPIFINTSNSLIISNSIKTNLYYSIMQGLNQFENSLFDKSQEKIYIEKIFTNLCSVNNILLPSKDVKTTSDQTNITKINSMKEIFNQDYDYFTVKHAICMMIFGAENNIPEAIRIAEKVCSDLGYVVPTWVETRVNKYLVNHSKEYSDTVNLTGPINVASVYRGKLSKDDLFDSHGVENAYDSYKAPSIFAVDYLPFKGLEEIMDLKKFSLLMRNKGTSNLSLN